MQITRQQGYYAHAIPNSGCQSVIYSNVAVSIFPPGPRPGDISIQYRDNPNQLPLQEPGRGRSRWQREGQRRLNAQRAADRAADFEQQLLNLPRGPHHPYRSVSQQQQREVDLDSVMA
ncbi:hypothetical protein VTI74DRAFT_7130 [Chaetomium olivicolor]